jgi:hypothetical protein
MFKLNEDVNTITATADVSLEGYEAIKANTFIPRGHRLWNTYQAWLDLGNTPEPVQSIAQVEAQLIADVSAQRKVQEELGVSVNNIRYSGDPSNRQALSEAIAFAKSMSITVFPSWKDSDNGFNANHPLADVEQAYTDIGMRRSTLIGMEGDYTAQVNDGSLTDVSNLLWETV